MGVGKRTAPQARRGGMLAVGNPPACAKVAGGCWKLRPPATLGKAPESGELTLRQPQRHSTSLLLHVPSLRFRQEPQPAAGCSHLQLSVSSLTRSLTNLQSETRSGKRCRLSGSPTGRSSRPERWRRCRSGCRRCFRWRSHPCSARCRSRSSPRNWCCCHRSPWRRSRCRRSWRLHRWACRSSSRPGC